MNKENGEHNCHERTNDDHSFGATTNSSGSVPRTSNQNLNNNTFPHLHQEYGANSLATLDGSMAIVYHSPAQPVRIGDVPIDYRRQENNNNINSIVAEDQTTTTKDEEQGNNLFHQQSNPSSG